MQLSGRVLTYQLLLIGWFGLVPSLTGFAQSPAINQLKARLAQPQPDSSRARLLWSLARAYTLIQVDSALYYYQQGIKVGQGKINKSLLADQYYLLGDIYFRKSDFLQSLHALQQAQQIAQQNHLQSILPKIQTFMASDYRRLGDYAHSISLFLRALHSYESHPTWDNEGLGRAYTNLGIIFAETHHYKEALFYHRKRLELAQRRKSLQDIAPALGNLGQFYLNRHDLANAESSAKQCLSISQKIGLLNIVSSSMVQLGSIAYERHQNEKAIRYHLQSLQLNRRAIGQEAGGYIQFCLAQDYLALKKYRQALSFTNQAIATFQKIRTPQDLQKTLAFKSQLLEQTGNYHQALLIGQQAQLLKDSLIGLSKLNTAAYIQTRYELERKQFQIQTLQKDVTIQKQSRHTAELQLSLARQQRLLFLTSSVLLILLLSLGFYSFRKQQKNGQLLLEQKEAITQQAQQLTELNATKDKLFSLIGHDLRSPLARLKYDFHTLRTQVKLTPSITKPLGRLEHQVDTVLDLLTNLLDWSRTQLKGFVSNPQRIDLEDAVSETISLVADHLRQKEIVLLNHVPKNTWVIIDGHQLQAVLRNVLSNAIKFTPLGGYIRLRTVTEVNFIELQIIDTGIGMTADQLDRLWNEPEIRTGTQGELSTGLGLRLCRDILSQQSGKLTVVSQPQRGTTVLIKLLAAESLVSVSAE